MAIRRSPSPSPWRATLWNKAFTDLQADPDQSDAITDFQKVVRKDCLTIGNLDTDHGRRQLLNIIDTKAAKMQSSHSPEIKRAFNVGNKIRNIVSLGAAANPGATVAVAGFFIAFDLIQTHEAEKAAIFNITLDTGDIICRSALEDHQVNSKKSTEPRELSEARQRLKGAYVQLYRKILFLTMRIAYKLSGWRKYFVGWSAWREEFDDLREAESRVEKYLRTIGNFESNPTNVAAPNWARLDKKETKLHRLVKNGMAQDVLRMIENGECPPEVLNAKTSKGWTALMFAVKGKHWLIMDYLLKASRIWVNATNVDGNTALIIAAMNNQPGYTKKLVNGIAKPEIRNNGQRTAWLEAAMRGHINVMKVLADKGDDVNQVTGKNGWCALHTAVDKDYVEMAKWLVNEKKAKQFIKIKGGKREGMTPKMLAKELNRTEILAILH